MWPRRSGIGSWIVVGVDELSQSRSTTDDQTDQNFLHDDAQGLIASERLDLVA